MVAESCSATAAAAADHTNPNNNKNPNKTLTEALVGERLEDARDELGVGPLVDGAALGLLVVVVVSAAEDASAALLEEDGRAQRSAADLHAAGGDRASGGALLGELHAC